MICLEIPPFHHSVPIANWGTTELGYPLPQCWIFPVVWLLLYALISASLEADRPMDHSRFPQSCRMCWRFCRISARAYVVSENGYVLRKSPLKVHRFIEVHGHHLWFRFQSSIWGHGGSFCCEIAWNHWGGKTRFSWPSGKQKAMERSTIVHGKIHYLLFLWWCSSSWCNNLPEGNQRFVKVREGTRPCMLLTISICPTTRFVTLTFCQAPQVPGVSWHQRLAFFEVVL